VTDRIELDLQDLGGPAQRQLLDQEPQGRQDLSFTSPLRPTPVPFQISLHHHLDQFLEGDFRLAPEMCSCLAVVALEQLDLGGATHG